MMMKIPSKKIPKHIELKIRDTDGIDNWFLKCQRVRVPFVAVLIKRTLADVQWNCMVRTWQWFDVVRE